MFYLLQHETDSAEVTYYIRTIQNNTLNTRIMHICARQISSLAVFQRAAPAAGQSPSLPQGRDLRLSLYAQVFEVTFLLCTFQLESQSFSYETAYCGLKAYPLSKLQGRDEIVKSYARVLKMFFFFSL